MKTTHWKFTMAMAAVAAMASVGAATIDWNGEAGNGRWDDPGNWKGGSIPGENDTARLYATGLDVDDPVIDLGGQTVTVGAVNWGAATVRVANGVVRLAQGAATGNTKTTVNGETRNGGFYCDVEQLVDGVWKNGDSNGNYVYTVGNVSGAGKITLNGNQNHNLRFENGTVSVPEVVVQAASVTFASAPLSGTTAILDGQFADGNFNASYLKIDASGQTDPESGWRGAFLDGAGIRAVRSGGVFTYIPPAFAFEQTVPFVKLDSGRILMRIDSPTASGSVLSVADFQRAPGTALVVLYNNATTALPIGEGQSIRMAGFENNPAGAIAPWAFWSGQWYPVTVLDEDGTLGRIPDSAYTMGLPADGGSKWGLYKLGNANTYTLPADADAYQVTSINGGIYEIALGSNTLRIHGSLVLANWGDKTISAEDGGKLVFAGEEIFIVASGSAGMYISAPIEWEKPEGSTLEYPNIVIPEGNKTDGIHLTGEDRIGHYGSVMGSCAGKFIDFGGESDRTIHGSLSDSAYIRQSGSGTLTLLGSDDRRSRVLEATGGRLVLGHDSGANVRVVTNATLEVSSGVTLSYRPVITCDGRIEGEGSVSVALGTASILKGATIAPGNPGKAGVLKANGFAPVGDFTLVSRFDSATNGVFAITGNAFQLPAAASTATLVVEKIPNAAVQISENDEFVVLDWSGGGQKNLRDSANKKNVAAADAGDYLSWTVRSASSAINAENATVWYDDATRTVRVKGLRTKAPTVITLR